MRLKLVTVTKNSTYLLMSSPYHSLDSIMNLVITNKKLKGK